MLSPIELFPPHLRNHPDAREFGEYLEEFVEIPPPTLSASLCDLFDASSGYAWEADIPPRGEWERHAAEFTAHLLADYPTV